MSRKIDEKIEQELVDIRLELKMKIQVLKFQLDLVEAVLFSDEFQEYREKEYCFRCDKEVDHLQEVTFYNFSGDVDYHELICYSCYWEVVAERKRAGKL